MSTRRPARVQIRRVSAERLLAALPDHSADAIFTDPPYLNVERHSTSGHLRDWFPKGLAWPAIGRVLATARRKLKSDGVAFVMTNGAGLREAITALERAGFRDVRPITWDRQSPGLGLGLRHQIEFILVGRLPGSRTLSGTDLVSVAAVGPGTTGRYPTQKPEGLGRALADMAGIRPGQTVVDPFCGSGALLVGALERGADVIGGDVSARAIRQATERLVGPTLSGSGRSPAGSGRPATPRRPAPNPPRPAPRRRPRRPRCRP
jgi:DNA modification methylase